MTTQTKRTGKVTAKASATDPVFQTFYVEQDEAGDLYYQHPQQLKLFTLPKEWEALIVWDAAE